MKICEWVYGYVGYVAVNLTLVSSQERRMCKQGIS